MRCVYCYADAGIRSIKIKPEYVRAAITEIIKNAIDFKKNNIAVNYHGGGDIGVDWNLVKDNFLYSRGG